MRGESNQGINGMNGAGPWVRGFQDANGYAEIFSYDAAGNPLLVKNSARRGNVAHSSGWESHLSNCQP